MKEKLENIKEFWIKKLRMLTNKQERFNNTVKKAIEMNKKLSF